MSSLKQILITGGAGFIGSHLADRLISEKEWDITVVDNFDPFYDKKIKLDNISLHLKSPNYHFIEGDICDQNLYDKLEGEFAIIVHLAAKAGVRPSIEDPVSYQKVNVEGTQKLLEFAKEKQVSQFVFASSSSVYGINENIPWSEDDNVLLPISPYAATKVAGELLGHVYSHLYKIRFLALRFFTVYGPRQRPDLAIHKFVSLLKKGCSIPVFGDGSTKRDYTYIDDIIEAVRRAIDYDKTMYEIINLGNNKTISLQNLINTIEKVFNVKACIDRFELQKGDVPITYADTSKVKELLGFKPKTSIEEGLKHFKNWFEKIN